jgi:hypothetical protein
MNDDEKGAWLPLAAASRALAVTVDALRKRIAAHEIEARKDNKGRWLVRVPDGLASQPLADDWQLASLQEELLEARVALARAEERAAGLQVQLDRERVFTDEHRARADRLEAELHRLHEEARRPWWRKLIG